MKYGKNVVTNEETILDRREFYIPHMIVCGETGTGKTTLAKNEIKQVLETTEDTVHVFGNENEYNEKYFDSYISSKRFVYHNINLDNKRIVNEADLLVDLHLIQLEGENKVISKNRVWVYFDLLDLMQDALYEMYVRFIKQTRKYDIILCFVLNPEDFSFFNKTMLDAIIGATSLYRILYSKSYFYLDYIFEEEIGDDIRFLYNYDFYRNGMYQSLLINKIDEEAIFTFMEKQVYEKN